MPVKFLEVIESGRKGETLKESSLSFVIDKNLCFSNSYFDL